MKDLTKEIRAYALSNAIEHGSADALRIMPKLFQHGLLKSEIKEVMPIIIEIVGKVNSMKQDEKAKEFTNIQSIVVKHEEKEKDLPELDITGIKHVVTRMAPEPSKYPHLGHAMTFLINYVYAKKYGGKCLLRFEDTNPEKVSQEFADATLSAVKDYLGISYDAVRYVSDDMPLLYDYAEKLVKQGHAFVCFCERDKMQEFRHNGTECSCRQFPIEHQLKQWHEFSNGKHKVGESVLRLKGDMQSLNHVMRDPVLFRRLDAKHYRHGTKYTVWPTYDFYNPIEDSLMGVTLILRSNEFDLRVELQDKLKELLGLSKQTIVQYGRFNVLDFTTKGREIRELFETGELTGWDDPRLITLAALERRGIQKEAYYELIKHIGLSKHPINLEFDMIAAINRKIIDKDALRYSFVTEPVTVTFKEKPTIDSVQIPVHPDKTETRKIIIGNSISVSGADFKTHRGKEVRLLHLFNIDMDEKAKVTSIENKKIPKINWVSDGVQVRVRMPTGQWTNGLVEVAATKTKVGTIMQFERFGFVRYDGTEKGMPQYYFAHA